MSPRQWICHEKANVVNQALEIVCAKYGKNGNIWIVETRSYLPLMHKGEGRWFPFGGVSSISQETRNFLCNLCLESKDGKWLTSAFIKYLDVTSLNSWKSTMVCAHYMPTCILPCPNPSVSRTSCTMHACQNYAAPGDMYTGYHNHSSKHTRCSCGCHVHVCLWLD